MWSSRPNYTKLKTNLRLCIQRLKLLEKKKGELALKARKEIADYISGGKEDRARIRVEHIVREDYMVEGLEILELFCDLLLARFGLIEKMKDLDEGLREAVSSIIWASIRVQSEIPEFKMVTSQLTAKFGKEFAEACKANSEGTVNQKLQIKLSIHSPPPVLIERYMVEIAKAYNIPFEPDVDLMAEAERKQNVANEDLLIDFGGNSSNDRNNFNGGAGGGGHFAMPVPPLAPPNVSQPYPPVFTPMPPGASNYPYPPPHGDMFYPPVENKIPPPLPNVPPNTDPSAPNDYYPPPGSNSVSGAGNADTFPLPSYNSLPAKGSKGDSPPPYTTMPSFPTPGQQQQPAGSDTLPDLPSVPGVSFPPLDASAGGEDVDFDDLTRRFEQLKKKK